MKGIFLICNPRTEMSLLQRAINKEIERREAQSKLREILKVKEVIKVQRLPNYFFAENTTEKPKTELSKKQRNEIIAKYIDKYITPILSNKR